MRTYLTTGLFIFLLFLVSGCSTSPEKKKEKLFYKALELAGEYKFDDAQKKFTELSQLDPGSPAGYFGTGYILEKKFQYFEALNVYLSITSNNPAYAPAQAGCWRILTHLKLYDDALTAGLAYNDAVPDDAESKLLLAESFMNYGQPFRSLKYLDTALTLGGDPPLVAMMRAHAYTLLHKDDTAQTYYRKALDEKSSSPRVYIEAAGYLEAAGLIDSAVQMSAKAVELSGDDIQTLVTHILFTLRNNYFTEARKALAQLEKQRVPKLVLVTLQTYYYDAKGDYSSARHRLNEVGQLSNYTITFWMLEMAIRAKVSDELTLTTNANAIRAKLSKGDYDEKFKGYAIFSEAMIVSRYLDDMIGLGELEQVPFKLTRRPEFQLRKTLLLYRTGQPDAFAEQEALIKKGHAHDPVWLTGLADIYSNRFMRRYDDAAEYYGKVLQIDTWYYPAFDNYVAMYQRLGKYDEALKLFDEYPHFFKEYPRYRLLKAVCMVRNNSIDAGVQLFLENISALKGDRTWFEKMHNALKKMGMNAKSTQLADWIAQNNRKDTDALVLAAQIYSENKQYDKALNIADDALKLEKESIDALAEKGWALYRLGKTEEALKILNANNKKQNFHIRTNYYLSQLLATEGMEPNRAANLARKAVFDSNSALWTWTNLSYVYLQIGRYDLARGEALKASHSYEGEPEPVFRLGMALYMEGKDEAREKLQEAIDLGLSGDLLKEARETLKKLEK